MEWFAEFSDRHVSRCPRHDWPVGTDARRAFYGVWKAEFSSARVTQAEAEAASLAVAVSPPAYLDGHLRALMGKIREARRNAATAGVHGHYDDMGRAQHACRECPECSGGGFTAVPGPDETRRFVAAFCWCGAGQLAKRLRLQQDPHLAARTRQAVAPAEYAIAETVPF
jgi:hypothetical protein